MSWLDVACVWAASGAAYWAWTRVDDARRRRQMRRFLSDHPDFQEQWR